MESHLLHKIVAKIIFRKFNNPPDIVVKKDFACCSKEEPQEQLPLFSSQKKSRVTQLCKVDMLIIVKNEVKVIIEIEESGMIPTKICGKFLTSGLSQWYIPYKDKAVPVSNSLLFIQVLSSAKISDRSSIQNQWVNIKTALQSISKIGNRNLSYDLIFGMPDDFKGGCAEKLLGSIEDFLKKGKV